MGNHYKHGTLTEEQKKLVEDNMPFLWYYWKKYVLPRWKHLGEDAVDELMSEMNLSICHAAEKWDPEKGNFSCYATLYFKNAIARYFQKQLKHGENTSSVPFIDDVDVSVIKEDYVEEDFLSELFTVVKLSKFEQNLLKKVYIDSIPMTKIAKKRKVTKEKVRKEIDKAIQKIRHYILMHGLEISDFKQDRWISSRCLPRKKSSYVLKDPVYP